MAPSHWVSVSSSLIRTTEIKPSGRVKRLCRQAAGTEWVLNIAQLLSTDGCPGRSYAGDSLKGVRQAQPSGFSNICGPPGV